MKQWASDVAVPRLLRTFVVPAWAAYERAPYLKVAATLRAQEGRSSDERRERAFRDVRDMVRYAGRHCSYYRDLFREAGFDPSSLESPEDLHRIPVLTKKAVREHADRMVSGEFAPDSLTSKRTSGSTGVSLNVLADEACMRTRRGVTLYRDRWAGWDLGQRKAMVWGNPPPRPGIRGKLRRALLEREFYLDTLRMSESMMHDFALEVLRQRPTLMFGHAHSLYLFARFWRARSLPRFRLRGVISSAMVLHPFERREIEEVFGTRVFDRYGCEEVSLIASECEAHDGLHVNTDGVWVEIVNDPAVDAPGMAGRVVVTDVLNRGMPFIRYEVGDRADWDLRPCPCGRSYPRITAVAGRVADYLRTPEGDLVSGISLTENFATLIPGVEQVQVIQDARDHLIVNVVPDRRFDDASRASIAAMVAERFGRSMRHEVDLLPRIDPLPSGKYRFSIYSVPESEPGADSFGSRNTARVTPA